MFKLNTAEQFESFIFAAVPWHHNENRLPEQQQQSGVVKLHCSNIYHLCFAIQWHCNNIATLHTYTCTLVWCPDCPVMTTHYHLASGAPPSHHRHHHTSFSNHPICLCWQMIPHHVKLSGGFPNSPPLEGFLGDEDVWVDKCAGSRCWENAVCRY